MTTLAELKAMAYFIGLTNDEVRQHGSLAKKQTWQDAIDYVAKFQVETDTDSSEPLEVNEDKEIDDDDSCDTDGMEETDYDFDDEIESIEHGDLVRHKDDLNTIYKVIGDTVYESEKPYKKISYNVNPLAVHCKPLGYSSNIATPYIDFNANELIIYDRLNDLADFPDDELISDETIAGYHCSLEQPSSNETKLDELNLENKWEERVKEFSEHPLENEDLPRQDVPTMEEINGILKVGDTVQHHPSGRMFEVVDITPDENDFILVKQANSNMTLKLKKASLKKTTEQIYNWDETFGNNMVYPTLPMLYRETILERNTKLIKEGSQGVYRKLKISYNKDFIKWRILNILREYSKDDISKLKELFNEVLEEIGSKDNE